MKMFSLYRVDIDAYSEYIYSKSGCFASISWFSQELTEGGVNDRVVSSNNMKTYAITGASSTRPIANSYEPSSLKSSNPPAIITFAFAGQNSVARYFKRL